MLRQKVAFLVVPTLFGIAACGGDDSAPGGGPPDNGDAGADRGSMADQGGTNNDGRPTNDGRNDVGNPVDVTVGNDGGDGGRDADAASPDASDANDANDANRPDVVIGGGTGLCNKAHWPYWITSNFMAPGSPPYFAVDGTPATGFQTGAQMAGDEFIQIDFHGTITFEGIVLDYSQSAGDYPRGYKVYVSNSATPAESDVVASAGGLDAGLAAPGAALDISFAAPATGRYVRLMQTGAAVGPWWSIPELSLKNCISGTPVAVVGSDAGIGARATWTARAYNSGLVIREGFGAFTSNAHDMIDDMVAPPPPPPEAGPADDGGDGGDDASGGDGGDAGAEAEAGPVVLVPNFGTQWQSGNPPLDGSWFIVDLGAVGSLHGVHITHGGGGGGDTPASLTVSVSTNDIDYTDVVVLAPGATVLDLPFGGSARFIRVVNAGTRAGGAWWSVTDFSLRP